MFLNISYWILAILLVVLWVVQVLLSQASHQVYHKDEVNNCLIYNANILFYCLVSLPVAWFLNNYFILGFALKPLVWIARVIYMICFAEKAFKTILSIVLLIKNPLDKKENFILLISDLSSAFILILLFAAI